MTRYRKKKFMRDAFEMCWRAVLGHSTRRADRARSFEMTNDDLLSIERGQLPALPRTVPVNALAKVSVQIGAEHVAPQAPSTRELIKRAPLRPSRARMKSFRIF
jgi:hypothetical protein